MAYRALEVTLLSAKDLKNVNLITRMEVYAVATISGDPITRQCTPPDPHGGRNPTWNATLRFDVPATAEEARGGCLHVLLRAERMFGGDRDVGEVIVPLAELLTGGGLGAPSSPRFASYQVCKVHRSETRGSLYLTYRLGPVIPPPPHAKQADGWPVVGYPAQQVTPPSSPAKPAMPVSVPSSPAKPVGHGEGPFSPAKPAAGYVDALPSPKPYGYGYGTTPPSPRRTDQVVSMTTSPKPVGRVVSMPPSTKPSDQFVSMRSSPKPVEHAVSMPPSPSAGRAISMPPSPKPAEVPMPPASPKSGGGHVSSPKSGGGYVPSPLKPSVHDMPPSPRPAETSIAVPSSPKPAGGHNIAMPSSPKPFGGHASVPPSPTPPYDQAVGERIFTMTMTDVYRCSVLQRGAATNPN
ncbi:mucin-1-like [Hordeum vulgare]|uniref:C2 domain-containing protein n=1 Tax=Hordeum vulgare subsp. vulgare TaxID=112509 RepID=A0A8I6WGC8_HORVV|nr:protein SRC2-like [Hordeum vulgare subsp. vulgare]KAE8801990.1 mucin-1-like [Hordeum vulgare]